MGLEMHNYCKDSSSELEKELHSPSNESVVDGSHGTMSLKTAAVNTSKKLVYPFIAGDLIESAAKGLLLGEVPLNCSSSHLLQLQQEKAAQKNHLMTMLQEDIEFTAR